MLSENAITTRPCDPLALLPAEIILRILDFAPTSSLPCLTRLSRKWHEFVDTVHQDAIFHSHTKTSRPPGSQDFSFLKDGQGFAKYFDGVSSWKDLCKRQTLLKRNWERPHPVTKASILQVGENPVWRFRADFKRRFFLSTSHAGGLNVSDMETGDLLWSRSAREVRPFAHLEYQDGTAVFDREGNALEVWNTDVDGCSRGVFCLTAVLPHQCETRGFQLSHNTLCVVSTQGEGFVYDMTTRPPTLKTHFDIENEAVGHLDQNAEIVVYSFGQKGYHIHEKASGERLGVIQPWHCTEKYHIDHPVSEGQAAEPRGLGPINGPIFPPRDARNDRLEPIHVQRRPLHEDSSSLRGEEWGAALLSGSLMVGISDKGRLFVCRDWRKAMKGARELADCAAIVECRYDNDFNFHLGGWLSVRNGRAMFEIKDCIYIIALDDIGGIIPSQIGEVPRRPSYCTRTSSAAELAVPVSFMALLDDCILTTYTTIGFRRRAAGAAVQAQHAQDRHDRIFPTKAILILSLAPDTTARQHGLLWDPPEARDIYPDNTHAESSVRGLLSMMADHMDNEGEDIEALLEELRDE